MGFAWGGKESKGRWRLEVGEKPAREERGLELAARLRSAETFRPKL